MTKLKNLLLNLYDLTLTFLFLEKEAFPIPLFEVMFH